MHGIRARLDALQSRREAVAYVDGLKLKKPALVTLARQLDIADHVLDLDGDRGAIGLAP